VHIDFWWGKLKERDRFRGLGVDGRTILKGLFINWMLVDVDWIDMARDTNKCWPFVNSGMNLRFI
jgi:hypothetical protein